MPKNGECHQEKKGIHGIETNSYQMTMNTTIQEELNWHETTAGVEFQQRKKKVWAKKRQCLGSNRNFDGWMDSQKRQNGLLQVVNCKLL